MKLLCETILADFMIWKIIRWLKNTEIQNLAEELGFFLYLQKKTDLCCFEGHMECVTVELYCDKIASNNTIIISVIYKPPNTDPRIFIDKLRLLDSVKQENKLCYFLGDYNINILNYETHRAIADFVDIFYSYAIFPLINRPTRITSNSAILIDNIFTNNLAALEKSTNGILVFDISDHFPVFHINPYKEINDC